MALARLFSQRKGDPLRNLKSKRCLSSSTAAAAATSEKKTAYSKKGESGKEQRAIAVESFVKKYMEMHPGAFPTLTNVHKKVGGSWYIVKDIVTEVKERMMVDAQIQRTLDSQVRMQATSIKQDINAEATSDTTKMEENPNTAASKDTTQLSEIMTDIQVDQRTLDSQVRMQATSIKQDVNAEAISEDTKMEENADTAASKDTAQLLETVSDIQTDQRSMLSEEQLVISERALNAAVTEEFPDIARLVESQDGDLPAAKHTVKAMRHEKGEEASKKLSCMISQLISDVGGRESLNGFDLNDAISNKGIKVKNGDKLPERKMTSLAQEQKSASSNVPASNGQTGISLGYLFKDSQTEERSDKKMCMENGAERNDGVSNTFGDDGNDDKTWMNGLLDLFKDFAKTPPKNTHLNELNPHSGEPRHDNSLSIIRERLKHMKQNEEQKKLDGSNICNEIERPKQIEKKVGTKEMSCSHLSVKDEKSSCSSIDRLEKVEEEAEIPFYMLDSQLESEDESGNESDFAAVDYPMHKSNTQIQPTQPITGGIFLHTEKGRKQNHLMVKFLQKSATKENVYDAFASCGRIAKISIVPSRKENWFNYACVYFKTEEGLRKALSRTNTYVASSDVLVESISPMLNVPHRIFAPDLVNDPNFPMVLLKNPTRTIMVQGLHQDIASHHLRQALSFCGHISGFSMGSSTDVCYVEFETEDAKEKALTASSISIFGRQLSLYRIDIPRTTVVRISNVGGIEHQKILSICGAYGQIKKVKSRGIDTVDVHFKMTAWARMVNILNSLNGIVVDGHQWIAQPGTVIPFEILQVLWREPDGQQSVYSLMQTLSMKIGGGLIDTAKIAGLLKEYNGGKA